MFGTTCASAASITSRGWFGPLGRLRGKLGDDAAKPVYILTARGIGYRMAPPPHR